MKKLRSIRLIILQKAVNAFEDRVNAVSKEMPVSGIQKGVFINLLWDPRKFFY